MLILLIWRGLSLSLNKACLSLEEEGAVTYTQVLTVYDTATVY